MVESIKEQRDVLEELEAAVTSAELRRAEAERRASELEDSRQQVEADIAELTRARGELVNTMEQDQQKLAQ